VTNPPRLGPTDEILGYKVTEKLIRAEGNLFVLGAAQRGQLTEGKKRLLVSVRGRAAIVGSAKTKALALMISGGLVAAGGATVAVLRPGEARPCGALIDSVRECAISAGDVVEEERAQPDGSKKREKLKREVLDWKVTKSTKYVLAARDPKKGQATPVLQVENAVGLPMNIDLGLAIGAGAYSTKTTTTTLIPGNYKIYVFSLADGPGKLVLQIVEAGGASK